MTVMLIVTEIVEQPPVIGAAPGLFTVAQFYQQALYSIEYIRPRYCDAQ
jgi:hypothetical protein